MNVKRCNNKNKSSSIKHTNLIAPTSSLLSKRSDEITELQLLKNLPKTTQEALDYLFSLFPSKILNLPPIIYLHQLYNFNLNRTQIDRYINQLKDENKIKLFKFDNKADCTCICYTEDIINYFKNLISNSTQEQQNSEYVDLINLVIEKFYSKPSETIIRKEELLNEYKLNDSFITKFINNGFLTIKDANTYWYSIPNVGVFVKLISEGRRLLNFIISKKKFREISLTELKQRNLKKLRQLGILYHCYDIIGNDTVTKVDSPMGLVMRLNYDD